MAETYKINLFDQSPHFFSELNEVFNENLETHTGEEYYRRFRMVNIVFGSLEIINRSLDRGVKYEYELGYVDLPKVVYEAIKEHLLTYSEEETAPPQKREPINPLKIGEKLIPDTTMEFRAIQATSIRQLIERLQKRRKSS